ncbi:putative DNA-directed RNA polymerases II [Leptomonas pyrrhocoris]|uniref:Putative DNA-directed RNA polymerases II n=1 Tax=Leptomonas pyrrhocoris TaxID=157538 RepID=A0A0M9FYJ8_LEPPY|nr:putative DNA-directed RNA polymerases II [Leptomonas pyrrhocoris]KPA78559.1 putative DNA-directed RNA polymerases II [Leptomonas pyrrhocoris]|eukprot:XP_015656998.1 putative DNA-directed RNA polymerases II [Leptomonas pyrrhocoris]
MPAIGQEKLEVHKCFSILRTSAEMMSDRKYKVAQNVVPSSLDEFIERYVETVSVSEDTAAAASADPAATVTRRDKRVIRRDKMTLACEREVGEGSVLKAVIYFCPPNHLSSEVVKKIAEDALNESYQRVIFVSPSKPNPIVRKTMDTYNRSEQDLRFELFEEDELSVNITHHELVPKHTPLSEEELKEVLHAHALELVQLPRILSTDPVARYYGLERGQVVRIERKSMSAGLYATYRQVV